MARTTSKIPLPRSLVASVSNSSLQAYLKSLDDRISALEVKPTLDVNVFSYTYNDFKRFDNNGPTENVLFTLKDRAQPLSCWGYTISAFTAAGAPRAGYAALTQVKVSAGTSASPTGLLAQKDVFGATPNWYLFGDKGTFWAAGDARHNMGQGAQVKAILKVTPNGVGPYGDMQQLVSGKVEFVFVTWQPA